MQESAFVPKSGPERLRELLKQPGIIRSLGAHDVFTALIVEQAGFECEQRRIYTEDNGGNHNTQRSQRTRRLSETKGYEYLVF